MVQSRSDIMKTSWTAAALLGSVLLVGCDRTPENPQNFEQNAPVPVEETTGPAVQPPPVAEQAAPAPSPYQDGSTTVRRRELNSTRPTTGVRPAPAEVAPNRAAPAPAAPPAAAPRSSAAPEPPAPRFHEVVVPANTALPLELLTAVSSETAAVETPVRAKLRQAVVVDGYTAIPAGAILSGNVIDVERAGRIRGRSRLALRFNEVMFDGASEDVRTNPVTFEGEATKSEDATKVGAGAVGGAIVGGILGGGSGAAKGAAVGAAAGTGVVLATRGREVTLAAGSDLAATLATPFTVRVQAR
jgi:hypothetical protein